MPQAHSSDVTFIQQLLILDPARRLSAHQALTLPYFTVESPAPAPHYVLEVPTSQESKKKGDHHKLNPINSVEKFLQISIW